MSALSRSTLRSTRPRHRLSVVPLVLGVALALVVSLLGATTTAHAAPASLTVGTLTTNGRTDPLGIPGDAPTFGWASGSTARDVVQSAYEVRVGTTAGGDDVWSSGKVASAEQVNVEYGGPALASQTRYHWQVRVWDGDDQASAWSEDAWFETGVLSDAEWSADWITKDGAIADWTNYTATFDFTIVDFSFGAFLRAPSTNDALMWQVSVADGTPRLRPHRKVNGSFTLLANLDISSAVSVAQLTDQVNTLTVTVGPGTDASSTTVVTTVNGTQVDSRVVTGTAGQQRGYVGFRADNNNGPAEKFTVDRVEVTATDSGATLLSTDFSDGKNPFDGGTVSDGVLTVAGPRQEFLWHAVDPRPLLRKEFATTAGKTITAARVYAAAHGVYELTLNGTKVGDQYLAPGWTDYRTRVQHQTYDVTALVRSGQNALGGMLGDGWWAGNLASFGPRHYGDSDALIAQLRIDYSDGTHQVVATDGSWKAATGPYLATDLIDGETYDARGEKPGWDQPGYDDAAWSPAVVLTDAATDVLAPQPDEPVRETQELAVRARTEPSSGAFVYDLGQNMVGVVRVTLQGTAGQTVRLRYGEMLNPDGTLYTANLRSAKATDYYTFATTGTVTYQPRFTFHGFRYLEVTGADTAPAASDVTGVVIGSDLRRTGTFETSDPRLNQLQSNITWGQRGNFLSIPTDTPARDERLGWTGDINVFAPTAAYNSDTRAFLAKWLTDLRGTQRTNGDVASVAPEPPKNGFSGATGWSDAMITVPYSLFKAYDDTRAVRESYQAMKDYFAFQVAADGGALIKTRGGYLDWLNLNDATPAAVISTAYFAENARMLSEMAAAIGDQGYADELAGISQDVRAAFTSELVSADGTVSGNSQAAYALALGMDMVPDSLRPLLAQKLAAKVAAADNHLTTGFLGTPWLLPALSGADQADAAYGLLMQDTMPSWLYEVSQGATTMWERWDSLRPDGSFGDVGMNSFNHYAFGAVGDWMYQNVAGLQALEPGYRKSLVAPLVGGGLTHAAGSLQTVYGTLSSSWTRTDDALTLDVTVPANTVSEIRVPAGHLLQVTESGHPVAEAAGVHDVHLTDGTAVIAVGSGTYSFEVHTGIAPLTDVVDAVGAVKDRTAEHAQAGDLPPAVRAGLDSRLDAVAGTVTDAVTAQLAGDGAEVSRLLAVATDAVADARSWLASAGLTPPVATDLDDRLRTLETVAGAALAWSHGVTVVLVPGTTALPGQTVTGQVQVASTGDDAVSDVSATVEVDGWDVDSSGATAPTVPAGQSVPLGFSAVVPRTAPPGQVEATVTVTLTVGGERVTLRSRTAWLSVGSTLSITDITTANTPGEVPATVTVTVANSGGTEARGQVFLGTPDGWRSSPPSAPVTVPAGGSATATVTAFVPRRVVEGSYDVTATFQDGGATYASRAGSIPVTLAAPTSGTLDHVDFGESGSETAHAVQGSASSGTNTEAGFTRRYAHSSYPGSWYSAEVTVEPGQPFVGVIRETFDGARTKKYNVYVDDVLQTQLVVPRAQSGTGALLHRFVIDSPEALDNDGTVRIKFEYPTNAAGFYDPSIADLWILPGGDDDVPPAVGVVPTSAAPGDGGWSRGPVTLSAIASDDRDPAPAVQRGTDHGWTAWTEPYEVSAEGETEVLYRAKDAAGNASAPASLTVRIDRTAPVTAVSLGDPDESSRTVALTATDAGSGVAATYARVDAGEWATVGAPGVEVSGYGAHTVSYYSVDVAGNAEALRSVPVELVEPPSDPTDPTDPTDPGGPGDPTDPGSPGTALKDAPRAVVSPTVSGTPRVGADLRARPGSWSVTGLTFGYQWLRAGRPVAGATSDRYTLTTADLGARISVRVSALREGYRTGAAVSAPTAPAAPAASSTTVKAAKKKVRRGKKVKITVQVSTTGPRPTGKVTVTFTDKRTRKVLKKGNVTKALKANGAVKVRSPKLKTKKKGKVIVTAVYRGTAGVGTSTATTTVHVLRR